MIYNEIVSLLKEVDLYILRIPWDLSNNNEVILQAKIVGYNSEKPTHHKRASYSDLVGKGKDLDSLAQNIFNTMSDKESMILLGSYNDYKEVIEWLPGEKKFKKRKLVEMELLEINCPL